MAAPVFASSVVAMPLLLDRKVNTFQAVLISWKTVLTHPVPMALWAMLIMGLSFFGVLTLFAGLVLIVPVLGHASWHAYRDLVDTSTLPQLGAKWLDANPYSEGPAHKEALRIGTSAYNQNCAACHGLEAKSGGIAPDLRLLDVGEAGDEWFVERVRNGAVRDGRVYMPKMADYLSQEALWAVRTYLDSVHVEE